jgi:uncharacterized protein
MELIRGEIMRENPLSLDDLLGILRKRKADFAVAYGVTDIGIFGSFARGEAKPDSDVDVVVKMEEPDLFSMVHIKESLEEELHCPVDIIRFRERMNPFLKSRIEKEAVYV